MSCPRIESFDSRLRPATTIDYITVSDDLFDTPPRAIPWQDLCNKTPRLVVQPGHVMVFLFSTNPEGHIRQSDWEVMRSIRHNAFGFSDLSGFILVTHDTNNLTELYNAMQLVTFNGNYLIQRHQLDITAIEHHWFGMFV